MPYRIKRVGSGYKVCKKNGKCFSKKPISLAKAKAQMSALYANESFSGRVDFILESVVDIPRKELSEHVFEKVDGKYKLRDDVKSVILDRVDSINGKIRISKKIIVGSILSYNYSDRSDVDVHLGVDERDISDDVINYVIKLSSVDKAGPHNINYYVCYGLDEGNYDLVYDVDGDKWVKGPLKYDVKLDKYIKDFDKVVRGIDIAKEELRRDIIDFNILSGFDSGQVDDLEKLLKVKLGEIEDSIGVLSDKLAEIRIDRDKMHDPGELAKIYKLRGELPSNVIYALLSRYYYIDFLKRVSKFKGKGIDGSDVDKLGDVFGEFSSV